MTTTIVKETATPRGDQEEAPSLEAGMVTAETAVTIPAFLLVVTLVVAAMFTVFAHGQACYVARTVARGVAVAQDDGQAIGQAHQLTNHPSAVSIAHNGDIATVSVTMAGGKPLWLSTSCSVKVKKELSYTRP